MVKKIILVIFSVGFIGILVWGGVNRTLAKTNDSGDGNANNQNFEHVVNAEGNGIQQRGNGNQGQENYAQNADHEDGVAERSDLQVDTISQAQGNGNGFQVDPANENAADGIGNRTNGENQAQAQRNSNGRGNGNGQGGGYDPLSATEIEALHLALDDEYHALAVYQSVIDEFGEVEPFVEIAASEQRHINALLNKFNRNGLPVPENPWLGNIPSFESVEQACQAGVKAEIANADLYDRLFSMADDPSLTRIFTNLSSASLNSHLPQFQACQ